jgi:uncharacterized protein YjdB
MKKSNTLLGMLAVLILLLGCIYCGSGSNRLMSIAVSPATATAMSPTGTVQFTAMGKFSNNTTQMMTSSNSFTWMSSNTTIATINSSGMAQCMMAGGAVTITASVPMAMGSTLMIKGTAVLTCM